LIDLSGNEVGHFPHVSRISIILVNMHIE